MTLPGTLVSVQVPDEGSPVSWMLPVAAVHVGCETIPGTGADGVTGCGLTVMPAEGIDVHPDVFVMVYVYVPAWRPAIEVEIPVPVVEMLPGALVSVHVPDEGRPFRVIVPVDTVHDGWIIFPATGAAGVTGCSLMVTPVDAAEIQPDSFVTVNV